MIDTMIDSYPESIADDQVEFMHREGFTTFGKVLSDEELIDARFAYARVWEQNPPSEEQTQGDGIPGHLHLTMEKFCHEPALMSLIGNDYTLRIAAKALHTTEDNLVYVGGYMHRQRLFARWEYSQWFWDGWHCDSGVFLEPLNHCNIWLYFNDCTREEGATQALVGSCDLLRANFRAGKEDDAVHDGVRDLIDAQGEDPATGTWAEAPAGGGFAWGGFLWHRIAPNRSGINRQLVTYEYAPRDKEHKDLFTDNVGDDQRQAIADALPKERQYLIDY